MKHKHESYDTCDVCNTELRLCKYCGTDIAMVGGEGSRLKKGVVCNRCLKRG